MNREIKFRCWDTRNNKYTDTTTLFASFDNDGTVNHEHYIILEQYTGLKDKNGRCIYEGDVMADNSYVYFDNGCFKTTYPGDSQSGNILSEMRCRHIEVISDIHEF